MEARQRFNRAQISALQAHLDSLVESVEIEESARLTSRFASPPRATPNTLPPSAGSWPAVQTFRRALVTYLSPDEVGARLETPDPATWAGRRDRVLMLLMFQTGRRVSELIGLRRNDIHLDAGAHVACHGKGRKDRTTPLTKPTVEALRCWLAESPGAPTDPVFPTRTGRSLSRDAVERRLSVPSQPARQRRS